jgi:protein-tyrosine-phosphatase/predicted ATP-grasp superfamily ATP-dependent carboligase
MKALVLGDDTRSFIATVRSLGRRGMEVHAAPGDFTSPALRSRYISRLHAIPPWILDGKEWLDAMQDLLARERFDVVIPCNETSLLPIARHRVTLSEFAILAIPNERAMDVLFDKHLTRELATSLGIPVPVGRLPRATDTPAGLLAEFGAKVVVKPRRSYSLEQMHPRGKVRILDSAEALAPVMRSLDPAQLLLEEFFPGRGAGVSVLAHRGRVLQAFEHHRVRETQAGSYYRISATLDAERFAAATAMVAALDFTGIAMFEFRLRPNSTDWVLLEANARPWGSLPLALAAGIDFVGAWVTLLTSGVEEPARSYRPGIHARNLILDLHAIRAEIGICRPSRLPGLMGRLAVETLRMLAGREHQDMLVRDDPRPGLREIGMVFTDTAQWMLRRLPGRWSVAHLLARHALRRAGTSRSRTIIFVCDGNICRSPFAALALRRRLRGSPDSFQVGSAGMAPRSGRASPEMALRAARTTGLDLSHHRSRYLTRDMAEAASVLVVFEAANRHAILARHPGLTTPILLLGALNLEASGRMPIADPIDGDLDVFVATYRRIEQALDAIPPALASRQPALAELTRLPGRPDRLTR